MGLETQYSREREASMRRARAAMIRRHIAAVDAMGLTLERQLSWMGVAEAEDRLADALELPAIAVAS